MTIPLVQINNTLTACHQYLQLLSHPTSEVDTFRLKGKSMCIMTISLGEE